MPSRKRNKGQARRAKAAAAAASTPRSVSRINSCRHGAEATLAHHPVRVTKFLDVFLEKCIGVHETTINICLSSLGSAYERYP